MLYIEQLIMSASLGYTSIGKHIDDISILNCTQSMCYYNNSTVFLLQNGIDNLLDLLFVFAV